MEWRYSGSHRHDAKNSEFKNPLGSSSPRFYGIKTSFSSLIIFQRAKLSTRSITRLCWWIEGHFEGKAPREVHQSGLVLARKCPSSTGTCNPEEIGPLSFQYHDHPPYSPDLPPVALPTVPWTEKQLKGRHFSSDAEVIVAAETWLDGEYSDFFLVACKFTSTFRREPREKEISSLKEDTLLLHYKFQ